MCSLMQRRLADALWQFSPYCPASPFSDVSNTWAEPSGQGYAKNLPSNANLVSKETDH
jgi:hypothetical protein